MLRPLPPLICGEYCVLLVGSEWNPMPTPGTVAARFANWRPLSGSRSIRVRSTTWPIDEDVVGMSGVSPTTVTVSATCAMRSVRLRFVVSETIDRDALALEACEAGKLRDQVVRADRQRVQAVQALAVADVGPDQPGRPCSWR